MGRHAASTSRGNRHSASRPSRNVVFPLGGPRGRPSAGSLLAGSAGLHGAAGSAGAENDQKTRSHKSSASISAAERSAQASPSVPSAIAKRILSPAVVFALAAAVLLLGIAALPQGVVPDHRVNELLVAHRHQVAAVGAAALAAAIIVLAFH